MNEAVVKFARPLKQKRAMRVLDLGSGAGKYTLFLAKQGFQVTALDVSETAMKMVKGKLKETVLNASLVIHGMDTLPFLDDYFDAIVSTNVVHHELEIEVRRALGEVRRVLQAGGEALTFVLSDRDFKMGTGRKLESRTYIFTRGEEKGITHHFF